jgi:geranylgeranyl diphosphate synthase type II
MTTAGVQLKGSTEEAGEGVDLPALVKLIDAHLPALIPDAPPDETGILFDAAATALLGRGKRARPILSMLACAHVGGRAHDAVDYGCAVEIVHAASLVLDDLPCMDNAAMRRGAAAVHVAHREDAALLVSIALLNQAYRTILRTEQPTERRLALLDELTAAVGFEGLAHGQMRDLRDEPDDRTEGGLRRLNHLKTGGLIVAALKGGGMIGGASTGQLEALAKFGECIGFAFQLCDDLQDATSTAAELGKDTGQDRGKLTFVDIWGVGRVRAAIRQAVERAEDALGEDCPLSAYVRGLLLNASVLR